MGSPNYLHMFVSEHGGLEHFHLLSGSVEHSLLTEQKCEGIFYVVIYIQCFTTISRIDSLISSFVERFLFYVSSPPYLPSPVHLLMVLLMAL